MSDLKLSEILERGKEGEQVKLIQEWLSLHGEYVSIDGDFGPATETAVMNFQRQVGLSATGTVDQATFDRLIAPMQAALQPISPNGRSLGDLVVAYAQQHLAQHPREIGGQNRGPWVRLYMNGREGTSELWCAGFACFCLKRACESLGKQLPITLSSSVDRLATSAQRESRFVDVNQKGKVTAGSFFLIRKSSTDWFHTGIVISTAAEVFRTIEGNTNDDGSEEGYEVCARTRAFKNETDFILIN